jgi:hypothetical protein
MRVKGEGEGEGGGEENMREIYYTFLSYLYEGEGEEGGGGANMREMYRWGWGKYERNVLYISLIFAPPSYKYEKNV